jgi:hypothetical protein
MYVYIHIYIYMYIYIYVFIHTFMCLYIYIHVTKYAQKKNAIIFFLYPYLEMIELFEEASYSSTCNNDDVYLNRIH